jgi:hypothetical protein
MIEAVSLGKQIKCAERELALRRRVYGRQVDAGRMSEDKAAAEIDAMAAICQTLRKLAQQELQFEPPRRD